VEGLSLAILEVTHLLCVDDIILFFYYLGTEGMHFKEILDFFCIATSMIININKSSMYFPKNEEDINKVFIDVFSFHAFDLDEGLIYLGYFLKPNMYRSSDWKWLLTRIETKINLWCNRWI